MKILILNEDLGYGGAEKMMAWLANQLSKSSEFDVTYLTFRDPEKNYQNLDDRVKREHLQLENKGGSLLSIFISSIKLRKYLKSRDFDIAIAFLIPAQIRLSLASIGLGVKVVLSQRSDPYLKPKSFLLKTFNFFFEKIFCSADGFVFQTQKAKEYYPSIVQNRSVVIPNPIKPLIRTHNRIPGFTKSIVTVSRLDLKQKRQDLLIDAFKIFLHENPDYILKLYGSGPDEKKIKEYASRINQIQFLGVTTNVVEAIQDDSMFVLTSDFEGIPNALLEAMSIGLPCISTDCSPGGASLLINGSDNGIIVPCGNVYAIAEAMSFYARNVDIAEQHGINATKVNERFSESKIANMWIEYLKRI